MAKLFRPKPVRTKGEIKKAVERIQAMHRKIYELACVIEESEHPLGKQIFDYMHDNGIFSYADARHCLPDEWLDDPPPAPSAHDGAGAEGDYGALDDEVN